MGEFEEATNENGVAPVGALIGEYPLETTIEGVILEGKVKMENRIFDYPQPITAVLKTVFSITVDRDCEIAITVSEGEE